MALGRFRDLKALHDQAHQLEDQLETRKVVDRAKGQLMDVHGLSEKDAFGFIQKTAMRERRTMKLIAERIIDGELTRVVLRRAMRAGAERPVAGGGKPGIESKPVARKVMLIDGTRSPTARFSLSRLTSPPPLGRSPMPSMASPPCSSTSSGTTSPMRWPSPSTGPSPFRHEQVATYKANRDEAPDILRQQIGLVHQVVGALRIPTIGAAGYEADDVIATLTTRGRGR